MKPDVAIGHSTPSAVSPRMIGSKPEASGIIPLRSRHGLSPVFRVNAPFAPPDHCGPLGKRSHYTACVGHHRFVVHVRAPREQVFDLYMDLDRAHEWIEGVTRITDVTGPVTMVGTRYTVWFGPIRTPTEVLEVDRPRLVRTRFCSWLLCGVEQDTFEDQGDGTRLTQEFWTTGIISRVMGRIFAFGSYRGSFRGELNSFVRIAEREAGSRP
jgi:hypothetical protein